MPDAPIGEPINFRSSAGLHFRQFSFFSWFERIILLFLQRRAASGYPSPFGNFDLNMKKLNLILLGCLVTIASSAQIRSKDAKVSNREFTGFRKNSSSLAVELPAASIVTLEIK